MFSPLQKLLCVAALASTVLAQSASISLPLPDTNVTAGTNITVQIVKPMALTGSEDVVIVIGTFPCYGECPGANEVLGNILYQGSYTPELHSDNYDPYQNFSIQVPSWYNGLVQLGMAHMYLLGAGLSAELQTSNTTMNVIQG